MRTATYPTLTQLWHKEMTKQLFCPREELDFVASIDTVRYDNILFADSMEYDFDMGRDLWLTRARFSVLQRDYLDLYDLESFLDRCESIGLGEAKRGVITQLPAKQHKMTARKYRWGNCMMSWTFRGGDRYGQPTLSLHSRVSYIAYIGGLDLALCYVLAREIGERIGKQPEDFAFVWHLDSSQFHFFKSLPALFQKGYFERHLHPDGARTSKYTDDEYPTLKGVRKHISKIVGWHDDGIPLDDQKYGPLRRIRRRYEEHVNEAFLPAVPIEDLTLEPLRSRG